jgi:hypothetical protein
MIDIVQSPADWRADQATDDRWQRHLSEDHQAEVLAAVHTAEAAGIPLTAVSAEEFPLPTLGPILRQLAEDMRTGCGFALLRGVPVGGLDEHQCEVAALGIAAHVGHIMPQGPRHAPLLHVRDQGADPTEPTTRSYQHNGRLGYHRDPRDIVAPLARASVSNLPAGAGRSVRST